jgi:DNA-directed RNA polymerase subunit RPC12/RpoP
MASYKCIKCGNVVLALQPGMVRCPSCANKILYKMRDNVAKDVKAR